MRHLPLQCRQPRLRGRQAMGAGVGGDGNLGGAETPARHILGDLAVVQFRIPGAFRSLKSGSCQRSLRMSPATSLNILGSDPSNPTQGFGFRDGTLNPEP